MAALLSAVGRAGTAPHRTIESLRFSNESLRNLPVKAYADADVARQATATPGVVFSTGLAPMPLKNPRVVCVSREALDLIGLDESEAERPEFASYMCGNLALPGAEYAAHCYCGHQFGSFAGQLGDGRAMYIGEVVNPSSGQRWEMQFKGAGLTPYSRSADGRAVLRSSVREFLCSEAMFHLGVPTTRASSLVTSDTEVMRDRNYDGNAKAEPAAVVVRLAPSFIRFGSFQVANLRDEATGRAGPSPGQRDLVERILDHLLTYHFPDLWATVSAAPFAERAAAYLVEIARRTAHMVALWQCIGFDHGVLNTDNLSALGLTIDYGPFGFADHYSAGYVANSSDNEGRYALAQQPSVCRWNIERLADALHLDQAARAPALAAYDATFATEYRQLMRLKLGLRPAVEGVADADDDSLFESLLHTMEDTGADFTNTFRSLAMLPYPSAADDAAALEQARGVLRARLLTCCVPVTRVAEAARPRIPPAQLRHLFRLAQADSRILPSLGKSEAWLLDQLQGISRWEELVARDPATHTKILMEKWEKWLTSYQDRLRREPAPADHAEFSRARVDTMCRANPKYVLRNWIAQEAIARAEKGDYSETQRVLELLRDPYGVNGDKFASLNYDRMPPDWSCSLSLSCSS